ncbi:tetracycline resistance ribosomal protection protein Otr(A) [Streptomyces sp. PU10]|uniref:tetracycline resistance ribosomal protection protein Otr(A) n=2 Tax=Streptomyces TaxID=1883 RepID=UPI0018D93CF3|nr:MULTISPECIES: tetracycline resistance ribosomal protection protein Otr(A) [unclassified Streptomyces]MBH5131383.1 tetracycline resistance ribosomal protection protein Otr(A) [Streptomyces sp. HB-N217]MDU0257948.1 tetracycline resistance ribosomal protection protein Otr(A) [Streptomyces sp. PU10]WST99611.1 tetracycline resistance ribosomal protection protein Otr(A) [Streptomyces sp. NBC_01124]
MHTLNIGILAHVDAGKTSLTERLLFDHGAVDRLGSVDAGDTVTDDGGIERRRGITVRSAVAGFTVGDTRVNLIDTPGHSDFVAEVERALEVLDGAVLLLSAVEGVQARTRVLMRTLRRLRLPTLVFVNKIDRAGARTDGLLDDVRRLLTPHVAPLTEVTGAGSAQARVAPRPPNGRLAEALAEVDPDVLAALVDGPEPTVRDLAASLAARTADGSFHPLFHGSALGGQGVAELVEGLVTLVPAAAGGTAAGSPEPRGTVFAVRPGPAGERRAYLRLYAGEVRPRRRLTFLRRESDGRTTEVSGRVTRLDVVGGDATLTAGNIAAVTVPGGLRVGDRLGEPADRAPRFAPPTLQTLVRARRPEQAAPLRSALLALADRDPLLHARPAASGTTALLLYGEVQMEVLAATLAEEFGIEAEFAPGRVRLLERPAGTGEAAEEMPWLDRTRYWATIGLRVEPGPYGSGAVFGYETELGALPRAFHQAVEETVHAALTAGLTGAAVTDCRVTLIRSGFNSVLSTAADFRGLTPIVLRRALARAGTVLYEPYLAFEAEVPPEALAAVTGLLASLGADITGTAGGEPAWFVTGELPARRAREAELRLPGLTRGEAVWSSRPSADRPVKPGR